jgi:HEPN domain-containing protein
MKPLSAEWVKKAEDDFGVASRELRVRKSPSYDAVCFHCQQCAEKYLKAFLQEQNQDIPKIHKLLDLLKLCKEFDASLEMLASDLRSVEQYSVNIRYPGLNADKEEAQAVYQAIKVVRSTLRQKLGLSS